MDTQWSLALCIESNEMFFEVNAVANQFTVVFIILILFTVLFGYIASVLYPES
jgi:hypothetical protein